MNDGWRMMTNNILVYMYVDCSCSFMHMIKCVRILSDWVM